MDFTVSAFIIMHKECGDHSGLEISRSGSAGKKFASSEKLIALEIACWFSYQNYMTKADFVLKFSYLLYGQSHGCCGKSLVNHDKIM